MSCQRVKMVNINGEMLKALVTAKYGAVTKCQEKFGCGCKINNAIHRNYMDYVLYSVLSKDLECEFEAKNESVENGNEGDDLKKEIAQLHEEIEDVRNMVEQLWRIWTTDTNESGVK